MILLIEGLRVVDTAARDADLEQMCSKRLLFQGVGAICACSVLSA